MGFVFRFASRGPHDKKGDAVDHPDALKSAFVVCLSCVFTSQEIAIKEWSQIDEVDSMLIKIDLPLRFTPRDHTSRCRCICICVQRRSVRRFLGPTIGISSKTGVRDERKFCLLHAFVRP